MDGDFEVDPADSYCLQLFCRQSTQLDSTTLSQQRLPLDQTRRSCDPSFAQPHFSLLRNFLRASFDDQRLSAPSDQPAIQRPGGRSFLITLLLSFSLLHLALPPSPSLVSLPVARATLSRPAPVRQLHATVLEAPPTPPFSGRVSSATNSIDSQYGRLRRRRVGE